MNEQLILDTLALILLLIGGVMSLAAGVGLLRFRDTLSRLHAATKPQILGVACILAAICLENLNWPTVCLAVLIVAFQFMTQPLTAHMIGRAAYRGSHVEQESLLVDELAQDLPGSNSDDDYAPSDPTSSTRSGLPS